MSESPKSNSAGLRERSTKIVTYFRGLLESAAIIIFSSLENEKIISDSPMGLQNNSILFITRNMFIPTIKICFTLEFY